MEEIKTKGIIIKATDFKDSDKLVTIFSAELGLIRARVRGVKKAGAKLAFAVQPFAFVEFLLIKNKDFYTVINATSIDQFFNITLDFDNYIFMLGCLEVCEKTVRENDPHDELFLLLINSLKCVCYGDVPSMYVFIKFMLEALKILGFNLELKKCACCGGGLNEKFFGFSYDFNGLICAKCGNKNDFLELSASENAILRKIDMTSLEDLKNLKFLSLKDLVSVIGLLCKDFKLLTDEEIETIKQFL